MRLFTTGKAIVSVAGAILLAGVPVMVEKSPAQVYGGLKPWFPLFYGLAIIGFAFAIFAIGYSHGRASRKLKGELPILKQPAKGRALKDLIYAANRIASLMLEQGELRTGALGGQYPALERNHDAWHDDEARVSRDDFMAIIRFCEDLRQKNGPGWMAGGGPGDFKDNERAQYTPEIEQRRDRLIQALKALGA